MYPITKDQLRQWLARRPPGEVVGHANESKSCPCARCFQELLPQYVVQVHHHETAFWSPPGDKEHQVKHWVNNPDWLVGLVNSIDLIGFDTHIGADITAKVALEILERQTDGND